MTDMERYGLTPADMVLVDLARAGGRITVLEDELERATRARAQLASECARMGRRSRSMIVRLTRELEAMDRAMDVAGVRKWPNRVVRLRFALRHR